MKEEKLEQLKIVFEAIIKDVIKTTKINRDYFSRQGHRESDNYLQKIVNKLVYEVKIRINNK